MSGYGEYRLFFNGCQKGARAFPTVERLATVVQITIRSAFITTHLNDYLATSPWLAEDNGADAQNMSTHTASIAWTLHEGEDFPKGRYSRGHNIRFDGGAEIAASASPHVVGIWAVEAAIDPEEMLVAALSSCHMLSFLHVARMAGFTVTAYRDRAEGILAELVPNKHAVTKVVLHPDIEWGGVPPDEQKLASMHHEAHEACFITNSVKTEVVIAPFEV